MSVRVPGRVVPLGVLLPRLLRVLLDLVEPAIHASTTCDRAGSLVRASWNFRRACIQHPTSTIVPSANKAS